MPRDIAIPFPLLGLDENQAHSTQPELTTPSAQNVRAVDPRTGRNRGGQRSGISKFNANQISGANPVVDLASLVVYDARVTYTVRTSVDATAVTWSEAMPSARSCIAIEADTQGNVYAIGSQVGSGNGINYLVKYNPYGVRLWAYAIQLDATNHVAKSVALDGFGGLCVCVSGPGGASDGFVTRYLICDDDECLRFAWRIGAPNGGLIVDVKFHAGQVYFLENTASGWYLHRYDEALTANPVHQWSYSGGSATDVSIALDVGSDGSCYVAEFDTGLAAQGYIRKVGPHGGLVWSYQGEGTGYAVVAREIGGVAYVYTQGLGTGGTPKHVARIVDNGTTATLSWETATVVTLFYGAASLEVDTNGECYQAIYQTTANTAEIKKLNASGTVVWTYSATTFPAADGKCYTVGLDPNYADGDSKPEYLYFGTDPDSNGKAVHRLSLLTSSTGDGSPRSQVHLGVSNGNVVAFADTGSPAAVTGGTGALSTTARWVMSAVMFNRVFYTDGHVYKSYDALTATLTDWEATGGGQIPRRNRLLAAWNGCMVISGSEDDPHNWAMSEVGNPDGWDFFPRVSTVTQAIIGNNSDAGLVPDVVTALIPYRDDLFIFGADQSIWQMTGHPAAGGRIDRLTDITGIAWGRAWCKDSRGRVFFFGSKGQVYIMVPGSLPERISDRRVEQRFANIDVGANRIRLEWDEYERGLHVFVTPYAGTSTTHYWWDERNGGFWPDVFTTAAHNPVSVVTIDGDDPDDRLLLIGGSDGYVRKWDVAALDDDGTAISSSVWIGPLQAGGGSIETRIRNIRAVLSSDADDIAMAVHAADTPDFADVGAAVFSATLSAGRNAPVHSRARGQSVWLRLHNANADEAWAVESITASIESGSRVRIR